jgi:hypothetical protein
MQMSHRSNKVPPAPLSKLQVPTHEPQTNTGNPLAQSSTGLWRSKLESKKHTRQQVRKAEAQSGCVDHTVCTTKQVLVHKQNFRDSQQLYARLPFNTHADATLAVLIDSNGASRS